MTPRTTLAALAAALLATAATAQDEGLYPQASAPDASFLRVYVPGDETVAVEGRTLEPGPSGLTPFVEVAPGAVAVTVGGAEATVEAAPNSHYSYVVASEGAEGQLLTDAIAAAPAQADLVFLNLSDLPAVDVFVPSAGAVAIAGIAPGAAGAVALRAPLTLDLELRDGETAVASVAGVEMVRSGGATVLLTGEAGTYEARAEQNTYE